MLKFLTIRKSNNKIEAISDGKITIDKNIFDTKQVDCTQDELDNWLNNTADLFYTDKPEIKKSPQKIKEEEKKKALNEVVSSLETATTVKSVKDQIIKLISNL